MDASKITVPVADAGLTLAVAVTDWPIVMDDDERVVEVAEVTVKDTAELFTLK